MVCVISGHTLVTCQAASHQCDSGGDRWTGFPPGHKECWDFGWHIRYDSDAKDWRRSMPAADSGPDLGRLYSEAAWHRGLHRWIRQGAQPMPADVRDLVGRRRAEATDPPEDGEWPVFFGPEAEEGEPGQLIISAQISIAGPDWWPTGAPDGTQMREVILGAAPMLLISLLVPSAESAIGFRTGPACPSAGCRFPATAEGDEQIALAHTLIAGALFHGAPPAVRGLCGHWWAERPDGFASMKNDCGVCGRPPGYSVSVAGICPPPPDDGELI